MSELPVLFIYAGKRYGKNISYLYYYFADPAHNDGRSAKEFRQFVSNKKIFSNESIGAIHNVTLIGDQAKFNKNAFVKGYWKNQQDNTTWKAENVVAESYVDLKKNPGIENVEEVLRPLRVAYTNANISEKRLLIAEILRVITQG